MKCDWCEIEFFPAKPWQRFHSPKCRDDWHNRERLRRQVERADERRADRINGNGHHVNGHAKPEQKIDLASLFAKPVAVRRRRIGAVEQQQEREA
jgi:hypothetical protein